MKVFENFSRILNLRMLNILTSSTGNKYIHILFIHDNHIYSCNVYCQMNFIFLVTVYKFMHKECFMFLSSKFPTLFLFVLSVVIEIHNN